MGAQRTSFAKLQRDRAKKAKAAAKRERRIEGPGEELVLEDLDVEAEEGEVLSPAELLARVESIQRRFDDGEIDLDELEEQKTALLARLPID